MNKNKSLNFSKRIGLEPVETKFQTNEIDFTFRVEIWNAYYLFLYKPLLDAETYFKRPFRSFNKMLWVHYFKKAVDDFPPNDEKFKYFVRQYIENTKWYEIYNLLEFILLTIENEKTFRNEEFKNYLNSVLKNNNSGYSILGNIFVPISTEVELKEIVNLGNSATDFLLAGVRTHLDSAIELLSKKPFPDYRNSIKESISMVEAMARFIEPNENTLGKALHKLEKKQFINKVLKSGFEKLYNYTNDKNGIRHALMDDSSIMEEEAKFFLVSCSAFTNYMIAKAVKSNLLINEDE